MKEFSIISCIDSENGIGLKGKMAWTCVKEMQHFRECTMNDIIVMGRITFESLPKKLIHRWNVVISSKEVGGADEVFPSLVDALEAHSESNACVWIIGGEKLYREAICMKACRELLISRLPDSYDCDTFFPEIKDEWFVSSTEDKEGFVLQVFKKSSLLNPFDEQFEKLITQILHEGVWRDTRNSRCLSLFCPNPLRFDLSTGKFPLFTTRRVPWKATVIELIWFLSGNTDGTFLKDNNVNIWNQNIEDFSNRGYAKFTNDAGAIYPKQFRAFGTDEDNFDQISYILDEIRNNSNSRRIFVSNYSPLDHVKHPERAALPPCHVFFQVFVNDDGKLDLMVLLRANDLAVGSNLNVASYALLLLLICKSTRKKPGTLIYNINCADIYENHYIDIKRQISRYSYDAPTVEISDRLIDSDLKDVKFEDIVLENYVHHPPIRYEMTL